MAARFGRGAAPFGQRQDADDPHLVVERQGPEAHIFVAQIIGSRVPQELADGRIYNQIIPPMVATRNDPLITVVNHSTVGGIDLHDLHHPNDFGYTKMAWNWYQAMARVFHISGSTGANPRRTVGLSTASS